MAPNYYELPFTNPIFNSNETSCYNNCVRSANCIQYIFFKRSVAKPDLLINSNTCYLKSKLNIFNGVQVDSNSSIAYSFRSKYILIIA